MRNGVLALRGSVCLVAFMALTGAKTNGCGPDFGDDGDEPPQIVCPDGFEFDGQDCVAVDPGNCPPDTTEQWVCEDNGGEDPDQPIPADGEADQPMQPPGECWLECVPIDPGCPEGTVEQVICAGNEEEPQMDGDDPGEPMPPEQCWIECVPVEPECPCGTHLELVCEPCDSPNGEQCHEECVPDIPEECPEGTHLEVICEDSPDGQKGFCYEECVPDDPNQCPEGTYLDFVCDEMGCYEVCIPFPDQCPEGTIAVTVCDEMGCYTICEDEGGGGSGGGEPAPNR